MYDKEREDGVFAPQDPTEWNPLDSVFVTVPPWLSGGLGGAAQAQVGKDNKAARNPVSHWRVSKRSVVGPFPSPPPSLLLRLVIDQRFIARFLIQPGREIRRGHLGGRMSPAHRRVGGAVSEHSQSFPNSVQYRTYRLVDCYASYFGSLTCVAWSHDGRFILVSPFHPTTTTPPSRFRS